MSLFLRLSLLLLLGLSLVPAAFADTLPLPLETMPGKTFADVKAQATAESTSGPTWGNAPDPSTLPVHQTFTGTVTADATMTKLAIFSDDGSDVFVDGVLVWSSKDKGQALPDIANSLHELPVTLSPGSHSVEIDYSNIIYTVADASKGIPPDIDGCTLFLYGPSTVPVVSVQTGSWQPNPATVGQTITSTVTASVNPAYPSPNGDSISQHWTWTTGGVYQSNDGSTGSFTTDNGDYAIAWTQGSSSTTFSGIFNDAGYYIIKVTATLTEHDDTTGQDVGTYSGIGYIGGEASDLAPAPGSPSNSANVLSAHQAMKPMDTATPTAKGISVKTKPIDHIAYSVDGTNYQLAQGVLNVSKGQSLWFQAFKDATTPYQSSSVIWRQGHTSADGTQKAVALNSGNAVNPIQVTFMTASSSSTDNSQDITAIVGSSYLVAPVIVSQFAAKISLDGVDDAHKMTPGGIVVRNADNNDAPRLKVTVDVSNPPANWNGTITLTSPSSSIQVFDASTGGNVIAFDGTHNVFSKASLPVTLYVQGQSSSSTMGDVQLKAQADTNGGSDTANLTVLWCDQPTIKLTTSDHVSPDDLAKQGYIDFFIGRDQLGGPFESKIGTFTSCGAEGRATVYPSNFDNSSFDLKLDQDTQNRLYINSMPNTDGKVGGYETFSQTVNGTKGNDTAPNDLRDDDQMKIGAVYQIDDPGLNTISQEPQGTIYRMRFLAKNFANITINGTIVRCSPVTEYSINLSNIQTQAPSGAVWTTLSAADPNAVPGDNMASVVPAGQQPPQTWNLK